MRIAIDDLSTKLAALDASQLPKIWLINGNEPLLIEEALNDVRHQLKDKGYLERLNYHVENRFDWSQISSMGSTMSLFAERRLIELRVPKSLGSAGIKAVNDYCNQSSHEDILLIIMPYLDKRQRQAKWLKLVESTGWLIDCYEINAQQFPMWIKKRLQSRALRVESGVVEMLSERLEGNLLAAAQEIDKLQVLADNGGVTLALLTDSLADQARFDVYALSDACLDGDFARVLRVKQRLQAEGMEPVIVLWALAREVRLLSLLSNALLMQQTSKAQLFKQHRIWSKREPLVNSALQRISASRWNEILERVAHLDQTVKGQRVTEAGSIWHQIEHLCALICGHDVLKKVRLSA